MPFPLIGWAVIAVGTAVVGAVVASSSSSSSNSESSSREAEKRAQQQAEAEREARRQQRQQQQREQFVLGQLHPLLSRFAPNIKVPSSLSARQIEGFIDSDIEDLNSANAALSILFGRSVRIAPLPTELNKLQQQTNELEKIAQLLQEV